MENTFGLRKVIQDSPLPVFYWKTLDMTDFKECSIEAIFDYVCQSADSQDIILDESHTYELCDSNGKTLFKFEPYIA